PDRSTGAPSTNSEVQVRREARTDREQHRSSAPDDLQEPRRQVETRRTVDLGHSSNGPSWVDLAAIRVNKTESRFAASLNRLLQQNRHKPAVEGRAEHLPLCPGISDIDLFRYCQGVIHLDAEISDRAFDFGMPK